jgi:glucuronokinase
MKITAKAYARIGLLGNPSDGYYGRTIACTITNFAATVTLTESSRFGIKLHPRFDPTEFTSIAELREVAARDGYYGGYRLLYATCKKLAAYCDHKDIPLHDRKCSIRYDTTIPRQVGLAGSSAIITAAIKALRQFYGITDEQLPKEIQPNLVLNVEEEELDIRAGLQDRVIQTYGGLVYMDFDKRLLDERGYGHYEPLDPATLAPLFLAYLSRPKDSGKMHSDVRARWHRGDPEVVEAMRTFARYATEGKQALAERDYETFGRLMNENFDLRLKIFGREVIGEQNMEMIGIARAVHVPAKFSGSGGAVVGMCRDDAQLQRLRGEYERRGYSFVKVQVDPGN